MVEARLCRPEIPDYALDLHTRAGKEKGRGRYHYLTEATAKIMENEGLFLSKDYRSRLLQLAQPNFHPAQKTASATSAEGGMHPFSYIFNIEKKPDLLCKCGMSKQYYKWSLKRFPKS